MELVIVPYKDGNKETNVIDKIDQEKFKRSKIFADIRADPVLYDDYKKR